MRIRLISALSVAVLLLIGCQTGRTQLKEPTKTGDKPARTLAPVEIEVTDTPNAPTETTAPPTPAPRTTARILGGAAAIERVGKDRAALLGRLESTSGTPVDVRVDADTGAVLLLNFTSQEFRGGDSGHLEATQAFLKEYMPLIDPAIEAGELVPARPELDCIGARDHEGNRGGQVVLGRAVDGTPVLGSYLSVGFSSDGSLSRVENHLASTPAVTADPRDVRGLDFASLVAEPESRRTIVERSEEFLIPVGQGSQAGLAAARRVVWGGEDDEVLGGLLLETGALIGPWPVGERTDPRLGVGTVAHIDKRTGLPDFVSYRDAGGKAVAAIQQPTSPAEIAYRFLEENPSVFRSGKARCQFQVLDVSSAHGLPDTGYVRLEQVIAGRRVYGGELVFEIAEGSKIMSVQGHVLPNASMPLEPKLSRSDAVTAAREALSAMLADGASPAVLDEMQEQDPQVELLIFPGEIATGQEQPSRLAYHVVLGSYALFIDAIDGQPLYAHPLHATSNFVMDGRGLSEFNLLLYATATIDGVPQPGAPINPDTPGATADLATTAAFFARNGWNGTDGDGSNMVVNTNVAIATTTCTPPNAFFMPGFDQAFFCLGMATGDVIAHELTHGVVLHTSRLVYLDESGALHESYADVMGNLAFPDAVPAGAPAGTLPGWLVGETTTGGAIRNMAIPAAFGDPATYAGYLSRNDLGCNPIDPLGLFPPGCDGGGVHSNSGITNRAHALMSDGGAGTLVGMGRPKVERLAFDVVTRRLGPWSRMIDAALATRASCQMFLDSGPVLGVDGTGAPFTGADCDQVPLAFNQVGLNPDLIGDWLPPARGFAGTIVRYPGGETTDSGCAVSSVTLVMDTLTTRLDATATAATSGPLSLSYLGLDTAAISITSPPIGIPVKTHVIAWTSAFGWRPTITSHLAEAAPPAGSDDCLSSSGFRAVFEDSPSEMRTTLLPIGASGTTHTGITASDMNGTCVLNQTQVALVDMDDNIIAGPGPSVNEPVTFGALFGTPVTLFRRATLVAPPPGLIHDGADGSRPLWNLATDVDWSFDPGLFDIRWRLDYYISQPSGVICTP